MKNSVTSRLLASEQNMDGDGSDSSGSPTLSMVEQAKVYTLASDDADVEEKLALVAKETKQKEKLTMDAMLESLWQSKEDLTPIEETMLLVRKFASMLGTTLGGFVPQIDGILQIKLEVPPPYFGKDN